MEIDIPKIIIFTDRVGSSTDGVFLYRDGNECIEYNDWLDRDLE